MLLAADFEAAFDLVRCTLERRFGVAALHVHRGQHITFQRVRLVHAEHGGQLFDVQFHQSCGTACGHDVVGHHQRHHLADEQHRVGGEHRFVVRKGGERGVAGNVSGIDHRAHAGHGQRGGHVHAAQDAVRHRRAHRRRVQRAAHLGDVVDVVGGARHLGAGAFVKAGLAGGAGVVGDECQIGGVHASTSRVVRFSRLIAVMPWLSSQKRCSRLPSTVWR